MSIKRPLVRSEGNELLEDLSIVDKISADVISEVTDKRFVTDEEKILIHNGSGITEEQVKEIVYSQVLMYGG